MEFKLLWPFYLTALLSTSFSVAIPIWVIFFQTRFSFLQISLALALQSIAAILFEIPSGSLADTSGRKTSVTLGILLQGVLWLLLPCIRHEMLLYVVFFLIGASRTLESGADSAWMVDWLRENGQGKLVREMFLKLHALRSAGTVIGSMMATVLLFSLEARFLFLIQGCGYILESLVLLRFAKESVSRRKKPSVAEIIRGAAEGTRTGILYIWRNKPMLYLLLGGTCAVCANDFGCIVWQPLLVHLSLPVAHLGLLFSVAGVLGILAPLLAKTLLHTLGQESLTMAMTNLVELALLLSLCLIHAPHMTPGIIVYLLVILVSDMQSPIRSSCFQALIPSRIRATVASVQSAVFAASSLTVTAIGGWIMDKRGPKDAVVACSFLLLPAAIFFALVKGAPLPRSHPAQIGRVLLPARNPLLFPELRSLRQTLSFHSRPSGQPVGRRCFNNPRRWPHWTGRVPSALPRFARHGQRVFREPGVAPASIKARNWCRRAC